MYECGRRVYECGIYENGKAQGEQREGSLPSSSLVKEKNMVLFAYKLCLLLRNYKSTMSAASIYEEKKGIESQCELGREAWMM